MKDGRLARTEPPCHTRYCRSSGELTFTLAERAGGHSDDISLCIRLSIPGSTVVPPETNSLENVVVET